MTIIKQISLFDIQQLFEMESSHRFETNFKNISKGIADNYNNPNKVNELLESFDFKFNDFVKRYTTNFKKAK